MELYKYQGAGNDFIIADNRDNSFRPTAEEIAALCDRHYGIGADGIMLLETAPDYDFKMVYFNSDGTGGMMCGNGGRCIVACAADLGICPRNGSRYEFLADDGPHSAEILDAEVVSQKSPADNAIEEGEREKEGKPAVRIVKLKMTDVPKIQNIDVKSYFLNTGTRHFVKFVSNIENCPVVEEGRAIRNMQYFAPEGTNVNFAEAEGDVLVVRTYEKGVEDETFACGTGITASAIAATRYFSLDPENHAGIGRVIHHTGSHIHIDVKALRDRLAVDFVETKDGAEDVWLTGPATFVFKITLPEQY